MLETTTFMSAQQQHSGKKQANVVYQNFSKYASTMMTESTINIFPKWRYMHSLDGKLTKHKIVWRFRIFIS